jgi:quercetin dioxygenase-like cupin family protein
VIATFHELRSLDFDEREMPVYDLPIGLRQLYFDPDSGAEHLLVRYPEGMRARRHRHGVAHTIIVIDGALEVDGRVLGPGDYVHHPANTVMHHQPAPGHGSLFVIMFDGPFDVTVVDD